LTCGRHGTQVVELAKLLTAACHTFPDFEFESMADPETNPDHSISVNWVARGTSGSVPFSPTISPTMGSPARAKPGTTVINNPEYCTFYPSKEYKGRIHRMVVAPQSGSLAAGNYGFAGLYSQLGGEFEPPSQRNLELVIELIHRLTSRDFVGSDGESLAAALTAENCVIDAEHPARHTTMFQKYTGSTGLVELATHISNLKLESVKSTFNMVGDGRVFVELSYIPTAKSTGRCGGRMCDLHTWTIKDNRATAASIHWGNPAGLDALCSPICAPERVIVGAASRGGDPLWPLVFVSSYTKFSNLAHGPRGTEAKHSM
jgi:hypothetical protein